MVLCDYCSKPAKLVTGAKIYPHRPDLKHLKFWHCECCEAYVGTHGYGPRNKPLGRLANKELRTLKRLAHKTFDPIWKGPQSRSSRSNAYYWLARKMNLPKQRCHIGMFNTEQCRQVINICRNYLSKETQ